MARLKDRQRQIPNGFRFELPEAGWKSQPFQSFDTMVNSIEGIIKSNPALAAANNWPTAREDIANWVDESNAAWCQQNGWHQYITIPPGSGPPNFPGPPQQDQARLSVAAVKIAKIWAGAKTIDQWINSNDPPVDAALAESRASVCAKCPRNGSGDFTSWFTAPAAMLIKSQVERLQKRELATSHDKEIGVCEVCLCPMKLKIHTPLKYIAANMNPELLLDLEDVKPKCWIVKEVSDASKI